eukprot:UN14245
MIFLFRIVALCNFQKFRRQIPQLIHIGELIILYFMAVWIKSLNDSCSSIDFMVNYSHT